MVVNMCNTAEKFGNNAIILAIVHLTIIFFSSKVSLCLLKRIDKMPEWMPIKSFANRAKVTPQAVYQRLEKDLRPFVKVLDGKKVLDSQALELFVKDDLNLNETKADLDSIEQGALKYDPVFLQEQVTALTEQVSKLQDELSKALESNKGLQDELTKEREYSRSQSLVITELARGSQYLLLAASKEQQRNRWRWPWSRKVSKPTEEV